MTSRLNRRRFLKASALAAGAGYFATVDVTESRARQNDPTNKLNIGIIGVGGQGGGNLGNVSSENIVALCDVDDRQNTGAYKTHARAARYKDFRVMLDKQKDIDAVVVSTPDHTHFHASAMAMRMGKHCYTEKPLTHSVWEARQLKELAAKHKVATQMGNMGTSRDGFRTAVEVVRSGVIGDIREAHVWTNRPIWPQNINRPKETEAVPEGLDWDLWLGPAPLRPYHQGTNKNPMRGTYVAFNWRGWWDFGTGALGDMGCHTMNMPFMALSLGAPSSVVADVAHAVNNETAPLGCTVTYEFPERQVNGRKLPPVRLLWYERRLPPEKLMHGQKPSGSGFLLIGARGTLYSPSDYGDSYRLLPMGDFADHKPPTPTLPRVKSAHHQEWIRACKGGAPAMSNFVDYAGQLTETVLLGNVAIRAGKRVVWNSEKLEAVDLPSAAQYIRRQYRKGWEV